MDNVRHSPAEKGQISPAQKPGVWKTLAIPELSNSESDDDGIRDKLANDNESNQSKRDVSEIESDPPLDEDHSPVEEEREIESRKHEKSIPCV